MNRSKCLRSFSVIIMSMLTPMLAAAKTDMSTSQLYIKKRSRKKKLLIAAVAAFMLSACATTQRTFDSAAIAQIQPQKSTREDVRRLLGEPSSISTSSSGYESWTYSKTGRTTGNPLGDAIRKSAGGFDAIRENLDQHDSVFVIFKDGLVQSVNRSKATKSMMSE